MADNNTNKSTQDAIDRWVNSVDRVSEIKRELNSAECSEANLKNDLGKLLCPKDAKDGESFSIWSRKDGIEMLLIVEKVDTHTFNIHWRK